MRLLLPILILSFSIYSTSLYSPYYKLCRLNHSRIDSDAIPIQDLEVQRISKYYSNYYVEPVISTELDLKYQQFNFYFHEFIDAGGSGEVYLVEDQATGEGKVVKRFFKEKPHDFRRQNYIMNRLNYSIKWAKDCGDYKCTPNSQKFNSMCIFPHKDSIVIRKLQFDNQQAPLIFYKILKELQKTHKAGIIHNDIKMGNIMINSVGPNFKFYDVQLIDWNLASFYYTGIDLSAKRGTVCYYAPQQLFLTYHITPAIDIWALGVVMYIYYSDVKPFSHNCKSSNIKAIASLVGGKKLLEMYKKYRYNGFQHIQLLKQVQNNPSLFPERFMEDVTSNLNKSIFNKDLIEVFRRMFEPDPELRATPQELMKLKYFERMKHLPEMYYYKNQKKSKNGIPSPQSAN